MQHISKLSNLMVFVSLFLLVMSLVSAFDFSICETPERAIAELGDDYYAFCESNVAPAYYSDLPEIVQAQPSGPQDIFIPGVLAPSTSDMPFTNTIEPSTSKTAIILTAFGFILLLFCIALLILYYYHHHQHTQKTIAMLLPMLQTYVQAGYTSLQITDLLLERGYKRAFIKKLFKALENQP